MFEKPLHLGAVLFIVSKPLINDGARTVCFPDPYMGQGEIAAVEKNYKLGGCDHTIFGNPNGSNSGTLKTPIITHNRNDPIPSSRWF